MVSIERYLIRRLKWLGIIEGVETSGMKRSEIGGIRYGKNSREFMLGHTVAPLGYNTAMSDQKYVERQYRTAEQWLNVLSEDPTRISKDRVLQREDELREEILELRASLKAIRDAIDLGVTIQSNISSLKSSPSDVFLVVECLGGVCYFIVWFI